MRDISVDSIERTAVSQPQRFFAPRRLGHANLFVSDYERAFEFYNQVAGFNEVYRQPDNMASFVSNGNTHHDLALTDIRSRYADEGQGPGMCHLAFEMETELELVQGYERALAAEVEFAFTMDHDAAHSVYFRDPDGNLVELYADVISDWWTVRHGIIIKKKPEWVPGVTSPPITEARYPIDPEIGIVDGAVFQPLGTSHTALTTSRFEPMLAYYTGIVGLSVFAVDVDRQFAVLSGTAANCGLTLLRVAEGETTGLHHVGFPLRGEADLERALAALSAVRVPLENEIDHPARRCVNIRDPDGLRLQFYVDRDWTPDCVSKVSAEDAPHLL